MPELRLADIQAGFGLSTSRFGKLRRAVREEVEREGLATKTLATNSMRLSLQELVGRMIAKFDRILPADNDDFNKEAILKLVHIEKANVARHVETKRKANQHIITHSNANPPEPIPSRVVQAPPPPTLTPMTSSKRDIKPQTTWAKTSAKPLCCRLKPTIARTLQSEESRARSTIFDRTKRFAGAEASRESHCGTFCHCSGRGYFERSHRAQFELLPYGQNSSCSCGRQVTSSLLSHLVQCSSRGGLFRN